jgi:transposase-like protein
MHSYAAQYAVTASGKLLLTVFVSKKDAVHLGLSFLKKCKHYQRNLEVFCNCGKIRKAAKRDVQTVFSHCNKVICEGDCLLGKTVWKCTYSYITCVKHLVTGIW